MSEHSTGNAIEIAVEPRASHHIMGTLREELSNKETQDLGRRVYDALADFPELNGYTVTVGLVDPSEETRPKGRAFPYNRLINLREDRYNSNVTIYHELGHLAIYERNQNGENHPRTSEEYCSIFSMARMPPTAVDEQDVPYLGKSPLDTDRFPEICQRALDYREEHRNYIQQCKEWLQINE